MRFISYLFFSFTSIYNLYVLLTFNLHIYNKTVIYEKKTEITEKLNVFCDYYHSKADCKTIKIKTKVTINMIIFELNMHIHKYM